MSSIDKYVIEEAEKCDWRVRVVNSNGRIRGYIGGEMIFDIADRIGYLSEYERETIRNAVRVYRENQRRLREEERRRQLEEERRRLEQQRQNALRNLRQTISNKKTVIESNVKALQSAYEKKNKDMSSFDSEINEIKKMLPNANVGKLEAKRNNISSELRNKFQSSLNTLNAKRNELDLINSKLIDNATIEDITNKSSKVEKISLKDDLLNLDVDLSSFSEELKTVNNNVKELKELLKDSNIIEDKFVKEQIQLEISGIDVCDKEEIKKSMAQIINRIEKYRFSLTSQKTGELIKELNKLEAKALAIKELNEYSAIDTYELTDLENEIIEHAKGLINELLDISETSSNIVGSDLSSILNELYEIIAAPKNTREEKETLKRISLMVNKNKDIANQFKEQYEVFEELNNELKELGVIYDHSFDFNNYKAQFVELEHLIVEELKNQESRILEATTFDVIDKMLETNYEVFQQTGTQYYKEIYFINKEYPGVLTRVLVNNNGSYRRTLVGVKIGNQVTKPEAILEMSVKMEEDVQRFIQSYNEVDGSRIALGEMVSYDSPNALERIIENGHLEITGEGIKIYNELFDAKEASTQKKAYVNIFEGYESSKHKATDSSAEKNRIVQNTASVVRYQKRK
mgnify:CR=1 FL=1